MGKQENMKGRTKEIEKKPAIKVDTKRSALFFHPFFYRLIFRRAENLLNAFLKIAHRFLQLSLVWVLSFSLSLPFPFSNQGFSFLESASASQSDIPPEAKKDVDLLEDAYFTKFKFHPLDSFRLLDQEVVKHNSAWRLIQPKKVEFEINPDGNSFDLTYEGKSFHRFHLKIRSAKWIGSYLVFTEEDGYIKKTGIQNLLFLDLNFLLGALGNNLLPVFRMPVLTQKEVDVRDLNFLTEESLKVFAEGNQVSFNVQVNLIDPKVSKNLVPLIDSFTDYFKKATELAAASQVNQMNSASQAYLATKEFAEQTKAQLEAVKNKDLKITEEKANTSRALLSSFFPQNPDGNNPANLERVVANFERQVHFQESMLDFDKTTSGTRKLLNRTALIASKLFMPRPLEADKIVQAMALVIHSVKGTSPYRLASHFFKRVGEGIMRLPDPLGPFTTIAAGGFMLYAALSIAPSVQSAIFGPVKDFAELHVYAAEDFLKGFDPKVFAEAYLTGENLKRVAIGMTAVFSALYVSLGIPHLLINSYYLMRDFKKRGVYQNAQVAGSEKERWKEKASAFVRSYKLAFIERQNDEQVKYLDLLINDDGSSEEEQKNKEKQKPEWSDLDHSAARLLIFMNKIKVKKTATPDHRDVHWTPDLQRELEDILKTYDRLEQEATFAEMVQKIHADNQKNQNPVEILDVVGMNEQESVKGKNPLEAMANEIDSIKLAASQYEDTYINHRSADALLNHLESILKSDARLRLSPENLRKQLSILSKLRQAASTVQFTYIEKDLAQNVDAFLVESLASKSAEDLHSHPVRFVNTFGQAIRHFLFSYSSFTTAGYLYVKMWNAWFAFRAYFFKPGPMEMRLLNPMTWVTALLPSTWFTLLTYPQYFSRITSMGKKQLALPTRFNGAYRSWGEYLSLRGKDFASAGQNPELALMEEYEKEVVKLESKVAQKSLSHAYRAVVKHMESAEELKKLQLEGGIGTITEETVQQLSAKQKAFFRLYFDQLFDESMRELLDRYISSRRSFDSGWVVREGHKKIMELKLTEVEIAAIVDSKAAEQRLFDQVSAEVAKRWVSSQAWQSYFKHQALTRLTPETNIQTQRILSVNGQMAKPKAMARGIRSAVAGFVVDKPIELFFLFFCMAGVTTPLLQPIQAEMFGENSWFHLSRYVFINSFIIGAVTGLLADTWLKLQQDERLDDKLGQVPRGKEAERGIFKHYYHQFAKAEDNTWWKNHAYSMKLAWANLKPALITMFTFNMISMGRLDLDSYLVGYMMVFFAPFSGLYMKFDQAFEKTVGWFAKNFPDKYLKHSLVQDYLNKEIGKSRLVFNLIYKTLWENPLGYFLMILSAMETSKFGTRSMARIIFGGYTPTEIVVNSAYEGAKSLPGGLAGPAVSAVKSCEWILTNNYIEGTKLQK